MINEIIRNLFRFIILVLVQVLVLRNIELGMFLNPFLYVLFILMLPFETPRTLLLVLGFAMGITIDMFYDTQGMHAAATVFMAFCRPSILKLFSPRDGYEFGVKPTIQYLGVPWFISYAGILIVLHHLALFFIEVFHFSEIFFTSLRALTSSAATLLLVTVSQFLFYRGREQE
jgi:rod shape-determining protein MreD